MNKILKTAGFVGLVASLSACSGLQQKQEKVDHLSSSSALEDTVNHSREKNADTVKRMMEFVQKGSTKKNFSDEELRTYFNDGFSSLVNLEDELNNLEAGDNQKTRMFNNALESTCYIGPTPLTANVVSPEHLKELVGSYKIERWYDICVEHGVTSNDKVFSNYQ